VAIRLSSNENEKYPCASTTSPAGHQLRKVRRLGNINVKVSPFTLGGNVFDWTAKGVTSFHLQDAFAAARGTFIETADVHSRWYQATQAAVPNASWA